MNTKNTWTMVALAAGLFAFIFFYERHAFKKEHPITKVLPYLNVASLTSIQVTPGAQKEIRADRTNGSWLLTQPLVYPAQSDRVEQLLQALGQLNFQARIPAQELKNRTKIDEEFGFDSPQFSLILQQGEDRLPLIKIGAKTALRDEVFIRVIGDEAIYVVDASLLKLFPRQANDWRDTALISLKGLAFDRVAVTSGTRFFELQRDATNQAWRMTRPMPLRADNPKIEDLFLKLQNLRAVQFVTDDHGADLASLGLQPPELELALAQGTNNLLLLQFGKSPANDASLMYARRRDQNSVVLVPKDQLNPWRADHKDFRDRFLITLANDAVGAVEACGDAQFVLQRQTNDTWRVIEPENFAADAGLVRELMAGLTGLQISEFVKDVVTELDFSTYGLASPARQYILKTGDTNSSVAATNPVIARLDFGAVRDNKIFVRRADENSVYAVKVADCLRLTTAGWQLRDRRIWSFTSNEVQRVTIRQDGKVRELIRDGDHHWSLAPGSQGIINVSDIEKAVVGLGELTAADWVDRGDQNRERFGFSERSHQIAIEVKKGDKQQSLDLEFSAKFPYATVMLDGQRWTFEFPLFLYQQILLYLTIPPAATP